MPEDHPWIQTVSGRKYLLLEPDRDAIDITDIAHGLSMLARFNGQALQFCSVAEHSVHVSKLVAPQFALWGLLHDAAESYLGDMPSPLKHHVEEFKKIELQLLRAITVKFGLASEEPSEVKNADLSLLLAERRAPMVPPPEPWPIDLLEPPIVSVDIRIEAWSPTLAKQRFLGRFAELTGERDA